MAGVHGQASVEYAGLLALAAVLGAVLALIAGPPLVGVVRSALAALLSVRSPAPLAVRTSAADIADVQSALVPGADALTPDAALLALARRHGAARADDVADALLLDAARVAAPWLGRSRAYRPWTRLGEGPFEIAPAAAADRDVETPTGAPVVTWIGVSSQRAAVASALADHASATAVGLEVFSMLPGAKLARGAASAGAHRIAQVALEHLPESVHAARAGAGVADLMGDDGASVPAGMRTGDVVIEWPVHRTVWRGGREDEAPRPAVGRGIRLLPPAQDYTHAVYLRPRADGLAIVAEKVGA
jgi:hypothetical protein